MTCLLLLVTVLEMTVILITGHSMIINPNGDILELGQDEDTIAFNIDLNEVDVQRENIPVFKNLKPNLYK